MSKLNEGHDERADARFLGWQKRPSGDMFPLFNITAAGHPLCHSTVSETTLRKMNLRIPQTLSPYPDADPAPWYDQGVALDHPQTAREAIQLAGLNYSVANYPLGLHPGSNTVTWATVRTDTLEVLGFVNADYVPVQNADAFTFFDDLVARSEATYEHAGMLGRGEKIWLLARLSGHINVHGNDIVHKYLLLTNSHDGSAHVRVKVTPIRVICNNTLTAALQGAGDIPVKQASHGKAAAVSIPAGTILRMADTLFSGLDSVFNKMAAKPITYTQLWSYVRALVPDQEEARSTVRTERIRNHVLNLHETGRGAHLARGTVWGAFNSVAEYTDHLMLDECQATRLDSIWFGHGEQLKAKAFDLAARLMKA